MQHVVQTEKEHPLLKCKKCYRYLFTPIKFRNTFHLELYMYTPTTFSSSI